MWNQMNSTNNDGGFMNTSEVADGDNALEKKTRRHQNVVPVVISQIFDSKDTQFNLFGMEMQIVCVVAILKEIRVQSTKATYLIEDHTREIQAIFWLENEDDAQKVLPKVEENTYVQVYGSPRYKDGETLIMILKMFQLSGVDPITNHLLQVIHARMAAEYSNKNPVIAADNPANKLRSEMGISVAQDEPVDLGLNEFQEKVYYIIKAVDTCRGCHLPDILKNFLPEEHKLVMKTINHLILEGHAYTTIDEEHFCVTSL